MAFKAINWSPNEVIGETKMDQLSTNLDWLFRNTPRAVYTYGGIRRSEGVKLMGGRILIPKDTKRDTASKQVSFGNFFTVNSTPLVTTGIVSDNQGRIFCTLSGIGRMLPNHTGFIARVNINALAKRNDKITKSFYIDYSAMGY